MKAYFVLAVLALAALCAAEDSKVVVLTKDNFDTVVNGAETILVKFFAPWCGHCKHLAPEYIKAAEILEKDGDGVILAEVDATVETELANRFDVHGYPTLFVFHNGEKSEYHGPREADGIVKYMRAQAGPAAKPLEDAAALEKFIARSEDIKFVAFTKADSSVGKAFTKAANGLRENYVFGITAATEEHKDQIVAFRNFGTEDKEVVYAGKNNADDIRKWVQQVSVPLAGIYDRNTKERYGSLPLLFVYSKVSAENDPAGLRYILNRLRPVAKEFQGKLHFVAADRSDHNFEEMNLNKDEKYQVAIVDGDKMYKSDLTTIKKEDIKAFAQSFVDGKAEQYIKSEDVPAPVKSGEVEVVVGKTFNDIITKTETDTFVVAYAPWCGHCKALLPTWEKLAKKYNVEGGNVRVAKIDATNNFVPSNFEVRGFPSIFWVPAGKGDKPMKYEGGREMEDFEKYIKSHASKKSQPLTFGAKEGKEEL